MPIETKTPSFDIVKAVKSTHRHPVNILLHCIGLPLYVYGLLTIINNISQMAIYDIGEGILAWIMAISLFVLGHFIEGNIRAITIIVMVKYVRSKVFSYFT